jgi:hypothetical protein
MQHQTVRVWLLLRTSSCLMLIVRTQPERAGCAYLRRQQVGRALHRLLQRDVHRLRQGVQSMYCCSHLVHRLLLCAERLIPGGRVFREWNLHRPNKFLWLELRQSMARNNHSFALVASRALLHNCNDSATPPPLFSISIQVASCALL